MPRPQITWSTAPLLLPVVMLAAGIATAHLWQYSYGKIFGWTTLALGFSVVILHLRPRPDVSMATPSSVLLLLSLFTFGGWYASERHPPNHELHLTHSYRPGDLVSGSIEAVKETRRGISIELQTDGLIRGDSLLPTNGKILAYLPHDSLKVGDQLLLSADVDTLTAPLNPEVFDYGAYLASQNIYHRSYVDSSEYVASQGNERFHLRALGERSRDAWFASLQPYLSGDRLAVAAALIMGKRDLLGAEVRSAYADTGAIHVLAVSGLHVGILALIVLQLLGWLLPRRSPFGWLRTGLAITAVWYFALVTGLSPSVQRAALMVTIVLLGKQLNRNNSIWNLLAIAALVMLVAEPKQLFQVGFQLSFAAVAGIALFARRLQRMVYLPGKLSWVWDAISVSTAAQLGTLPLSLYYFGQFPLYFMVSGTLVIVFAYGVLALGLLHGFLAAVGVAGVGLLPTGTLLYWVVGLQNAFIFYCRKLPGATLQLADFGLPSVVGMYVAIASLAYLAFRPSHRGRWVLMGAVGALVSFWLLRPVLSPVPAQFTIYHLPRTTLIDVYDGHSAMAIGDSVAQDQLGYNVTPLRRKLGLTFSEPLPFATDTMTNAAAVRYPLLRLLDRTVLLLDKKNKGVAGPPRLSAGLANASQVQGIGLVIIRGGLRPDRVGSLPPGAEIVVDGSNPPWIGQLWKEAYPGAHVTSVDGAYRWVTH